MSEKPPGAASGRSRALWLVLGLVLVAVMGAGALELLRTPPADPLPVLGQLPAFELVERSGGTLTSRELEGRVWVAGFIFTRCTGICPVVSGAMAGVRARLDAPERERLRLVSFSVDPLHDTPQVLREYASRLGAEDASWLFLTGERAELYELIQKGFLLSVAELPPGQTASAGELITHSDRLVLVDGRQQIRGYYRSTEPASVATLVDDIKRLVAAGG